MMNLSVKIRRGIYTVMGIGAAFLFMAVGAESSFAGGLYGPTASYTPPATILPAEVSTDNLTAIFSTIISNPVVLTLVLVSLAVALFGSVMRVFRRLRSA